MPSLSRARIVIVGGGVLGMSIAAALKARGAAPVVVDPAAFRSASAIAAGMIAPALEAVLEGADPARADLYREAAIRWPDFALRHGLELVEDGSEWRGGREAMAQGLAELGYAFETTTRGLFIPGERRVAAARSLAGLAALVGGDPICDRVRSVERAGSGWLVRTQHTRLAADMVVLATGWEASGIQVDGAESWAGTVTPIRGQLIAMTVPGDGQPCRTVRGEGVYVVPAAGEVIVGATMEPGQTRTEPDQATSLRLRDAATALVPELAAGDVLRAAVGIRGATPDGLPLAGRLGDGLFVAVAPRRNGWLLGPLIGEVVAGEMASETRLTLAEAFRPDRFDPA